MKLSFIALLCLFVSGCAFAPQQAHIRPTVSVAPSSQGAGVTVAVRVVDERPSKSLGRRGTAYGAAAEITSAEEIAVIVQREINAGLVKKGFKVSDFKNDANPRMTVEVRLLEYSTSQGFWTGGVHIKGSLKVIAFNGAKNYEKMYRSEKEERVVVVPTAETNEKWINDALSAVLNQLFEDNALLGFIKGA